MHLRLEIILLPFALLLSPSFGEISLSSLHNGESLDVLAGSTFKDHNEDLDDKSGISEDISNDLNSLPIEAPNKTTLSAVKTDPVSSIAVEPSVTITPVSTPITSTPMPTTSLPALINTTTVPSTTLTPVPANTTTPVPTTTTPVPTTTTPVPTTTTPVPANTTTVPTTTTPVPANTTTVPTTTTPVPANTTTVPTTTTPVPANTTTVPTTTTISPITTPKPPTIGHWEVKDGNHSCIVLEMNSEFVLPYKNVKGETSFGTIGVPITAFVNGTCPNKILLYWPTPFNMTNTLTIVFKHNETVDGDRYHLESITFSGFADNQTFPDSQAKTSFHVYYESNDAFSTPLNSSYRCISSQNLTLVSDLTGATVMLKDLRFEAFKMTGSEFDKEHVCYMDEITSDIVPIAVGCTLAGLVVIVMVSYIIGRRRARTRGYQSV